MSQADALLQIAKAGWWCGAALWSIGVALFLMLLKDRGGRR